MAQPHLERGRHRADIINDYDGFVEKFKPKKTTDDCYTPQAYYDRVVEWIDAQVMPLAGRRILRPFWPGADYTTADYQPGDIVIDNPPFSILTKIVEFYLERKVDFWLFAPTLTAGNYLRHDGVTVVVTGSDIQFDNGADIPISFITNIYEDGTKMHVAGELTKHLVPVQRKVPANKPKISFPDNVTSSTLMMKVATRGIELNLSSSDCRFVRKAGGKSIFGGGLLLSDKAAAEKAAAEKAAAEKAAAEKAAAEKAAAEKAAAEKAAAEKIQLTPEELEIIKELNSHYD